MTSPLVRALRRLSDTHAKIDPDSLLKAARESAANLDGSDSHENMITLLGFAVEALCEVINESRGHTAAPPQSDWLTLGDSEVRVEYDYSTGQRGRYTGPPEFCYPDEPEEVVILSVLVNGIWVDAGEFGEEVVDRWENEIIDMMAAKRESEQEERAERMAEDRYD